jgi:chromosome segregation ATPase
VRHLEAHKDCETNLESRQTELTSALQAVQVLKQELSELEGDMSSACGEERLEQVKGLHGPQGRRGRHPTSTRGGIEEAFWEGG